MSVSTPALALASAAPDEPAAAPAVEDTPALALFRQGRSLLEAKDYAAAAAKFEESFRLDPGGGTKLNLALAYELGGKTASAWASFEEALRMARRDARTDRVEEAEGHLRRLEARLSRLRVAVPAQARVPGLQVLRDGVVLDEAVWGAAAPVDPGPHQVEARAAGKRPWLATVIVGDSADQKEVTVAALEDLTPPPRTSSRLRRAGWISLAVGAAGLAGAGATALAASAKNPACPGGNCPPTAQGQVDTYSGLRTASTVTFWVGGGVAAAGLLMVLLAPAPESAASVVVAPRFAGIAGRF
jgi:hypothetical protein